LLAAAARAPHAVVLGNRLDDRGGDPIPPVRRRAILAADRCLRWLTRSPVRDTQCGLRVYPAAFLRSAGLRGERFVLETEALLGASRLGHPLVSVPVRAIYPPGRRSRFRALADGARIAWYLARESVVEAGRRLASEPVGRRLRPSVSGRPSLGGAA
ncbi:MAG: hypothetical protein ACREMB_24315, partial [Candidatus Rokuibacteriota bacterium]